MFAQRQSQRSFQQDHKQGKQAEDDVHSLLQTLTQHKLIHHKNKFAPFDYESTTTLIELKDRNCYYNSYADTMINYLKVERALTSVKRVFFAFKFIDGIYYIKFNKQKFEEYRTNSFKLDDRCDYIEAEKQRIYIPIQDLKCLARFEVKAMFLPD